MRIPLDLPPGLNGDDTTFAAAGRWADGSNVRFWRGKPQTIGGWELMTSTALSGACRSVFGWADNSAVLNIAFGTTSHLYVAQDGTVSDITPYGPPTLLGADPIATTNLSDTITITHTAHGLADADDVLIAGATATGGIAADDINGTRAITVVDDDSYTVTADAAATSTATGGGSAVIVTPQVLLPAGQVDGTGGQGYGTGTYSTGTYSSPSTEEFFPRTWALAAWGENLLANPRNGGIYGWENDTSARAVALVNAPPQVRFMLVATTRQVFALGCNEETSGVFNPACLRHSSVGDNTVWNTGSDTTAREYILPGGAAIVAGRLIGDNILIWTTNALFVGSFVGDLDEPWRFDQVGQECGLIGPNAAVVVGQRAFWIGPNLQFYAYTLGGEALLADCPIRDAFADNMASSQGDKIVASSNSLFNEIRFDYPDARDGNENSRYVAAHVPTLLNNPENAWYQGIMARMAFCDAPPSANTYPIGVDTSGNVYWQDKGQSADGSPFAWFIRSADTYLDPNVVMKVRAIWPDFKDQAGPIMVDVTTRFTTQGDETTVSGSNMAPGDAKSDVLATGRLARVKFSGNASPTYARMGNPTFDVAATGQR